MMSVHEAVSHPQFLSTNRHIMQGYVDLASYPVWDPAAKTLSGKSRIVKGEPYEIVIAENGYRASAARADGAAGKIRRTENGLAVLSLCSGESRDAAWSSPLRSNGKFKKQLPEF